MHVVGTLQCFPHLAWLVIRDVALVSVNRSQRANFKAENRFYSHTPVFLNIQNFSVARRQSP